MIDYNDEEDIGITMITNVNSPVVFFFLRLKEKKKNNNKSMEAYKVLIAVIFITTSSSFTHGAPWGGTASTAQVLINYVIPQRVRSAIQEV